MKHEFTNRTIHENLERLEQEKYINPEKTINFGLEVYSLCVSEKCETGMAVSLWCVGEAYFDMSKYEKAMPYLLESIKLSQKQKICDLKLLTYLTIGDLYFDTGEYEKSLDYYNYAEKLTKIITSSKNYFNFSTEYYNAKIFNRIGEIYRIFKCYEDANIYYKMSAEHDIKLKFEATRGVVLSNLGNVQYCLGNYDKALECLSEAITHLMNYNYKIGIVEACGLIALIYEKKENYDESEKYFSKGLSIASEIDYAYIKIDILLYFINFLENAGRRKEAIIKLGEVYNISLNNKMYARTMEICKMAIKIYEKENDKLNADRYYKLYFDNEKELELIELNNRVRNLKMKVQLDSLEVENKSILEKSEAFRMKSEDLIEIIKNISIISELGEKITSTLNLDQIYEMLYDTILIFMEACSFGIALYNKRNKTLEYKYLIDENVKKRGHIVDINNKSSIAVKCLKENKIIVINDMYNEYSNYISDEQFIIENKENNNLNSAIYCPLAIDNNLIGVITVQVFEKDSFKMLTIEMIKALSSYAAIAINNAIKSTDLVIEVEQRRKIQLQLQNTNKRLIHLSENDGLTGIPNRRKFDSIITQEWDRAKERKCFISIIIFDIDCFKQYNDNYGHTDGDDCLIKICNELRKSLIKNYFAARYGGDEFVIVLPDSNIEEATVFGEKFRRNVEELSIPHKFSKVINRVTVTLGVSSVIPNNENTITEFIRVADNALYEAKNMGRNQIVGFNS